MMYFTHHFSTQEYLPLAVELSIGYVGTGNELSIVEPLIGHSQNLGMRAETPH